MTTADDDKLVIAFHANSPTEAELVRVLLEEAKIFAVIPNSHNPLPGLDLNPFDPDSGNVGCDVFVRASDLKAAQDTIEQSKQGENGD